MARGQAHSDETRAAVMAALLAGQAVSEVAKEFKLDASVVSRWRKQLPDKQLQEVARKKGEKIEELLFDYLASTLAGLKKQVEVLSEPSYLKIQPADQAAVLHGVMADKAIRLLEAIGSAGAES